MGNQALLPSQIQSVENYLLDLKTYVQFRSSLGSTTFMKTAKVNLIESLIDDALLEMRSLSYGESNASNNTNNSILSFNLNNATMQAVSSNSNNNSIANINQNVNTSTNFYAKNYTQQTIKNRIRLQRLREMQQQVVVKIFPKYDLSIRLDLYSKRVREIKNIINNKYGLCTNCLPFHELIITDRAAFLFRQYIKFNLYDRMSTRPFLTLIEKKWIAFQLLCAVNEIHSLQIVHGDIKVENVLINSFLWVSLADFASYKPVYLSKNHPSADFNYFFDISNRRTCYLAPERLNNPRENSSTNRQSHLLNLNANTVEQDSGIDELMPPDPNEFKPSMDIFSLGCVLAELFMERPLFDFAHFLAYKERKYDPKAELQSEIADKDILDMIFNMLNIDEEKRKSANEHLQEQNDKAFPSYFVFLKNYISTFINVSYSADEIVVKLRNDMPLLLKNFKLNLGNETSGQEASSMYNDQLSAMKKSTMVNSESSSNTNNAFLILSSLLLSCIRKVKYSENKLIAIDLMGTFCKFLDDSVILNRILPYYLSLVDEYAHQTQSPIVKSHVIYALNDCLSSIYNIDVQNLNIFPEIVFDVLDKLSKDASFLVRSAVAKTISNFALTSLRYLDMAFLTKRSYLNSNENAIDTNTNEPNDSTPLARFNSNTLMNELANVDVDSAQSSEYDRERFATYEKEHEYYQYRITEIVLHLITDLSQTANSSNAVKETLIRSDITKLCSFFGRQKTSEFLLPHMITILNEKSDWSVRAAFFDALCPVLSCIGWESVEIVKSLLEQGLRDGEEFVIYRTLITLSKMVEIGLLDRQQIYYFLNNHVAPLLCHPTLWIRYGAINFICQVCKQNGKLSKKFAKNSHIVNNNGLNSADILCSVTPILDKYLKRKDVLNYEKEEILFSSMKSPIKRCVYDCILQDGRSDQLFIYLDQRSEIRNLTNSNYLPSYVDCSDPNVQNLFERLCKLGFIEEDEDKLLNLRDFMDKTRKSRLSSSIHNTDMMLNASSNSSTSMASILNSSSLSSHVKDGMINLALKERKFNTESLSARKLFYQGDTIQSTFKHLDSSSNQTSVKHKSSGSMDEGKLLDASNDAELLFAPNESLNQRAAPSKLMRNSPQQDYKLQRQRFNSFTQNQAQHHAANKKTASTNCRVELETYLDRCKYIYDEQLAKHSKIVHFKEAINASITSNNVCLSTSIGKWKPKGFLLAQSNEHCKEINRICRNVDAAYFATCSTAESCVKIWSLNNILDGKSGFFKSVFTYDFQQTSSSSSSSSTDKTARPNCLTFCNKNSLAVLCDDFKFYLIDFNANRSHYRLYANDKLFKTNMCKSAKFDAATNNKNTSFDKLTFYYLSRQFRNAECTAHCDKKGAATCFCSHNYPIEMIRIDDSCSQWPIAANNFYEYFQGSRGSPITGLFCYSTSNGDLNSIDMRIRNKAFDIKRDLKRGYITAMITDPWNTWIAMGTSCGYIEIYDFRFMLPIQVFEHRSKTSVVRLCNHPMLNNRIVASYQGNNEICVWNIDLGHAATKSMNKSMSQQKASLVGSNPELVYWGVQSVPPLSQNKICNSYISGMVACSARDEHGTNGLICASSDMKMRFIDLDNPSTDSYLISSAFNFQQTPKLSSDLTQTPNSGSSTSSLLQSTSVNSICGQSTTFEMRQIEGTQVLLEADNSAQRSTSSQDFANSTTMSTAHSAYNSSALTHQSYFTHHQDAITDLNVCYNQSINKNQPIIVLARSFSSLNVKRNEKSQEGLLTPSLKSQLNYAINLNDSRNFASLAWFGLWGKAPKTSEINPIDLNSTVPVEAIKAAQNVDEQKLSEAKASLTDDSAVSGYIPEPPPIVDENVILNAIGEPTLQSLGLGSYYTPVGWIQNILEILHADLGLTWVQSICLFAMVLRIFLFPITIKSQRNAVKMRKVAPQMARLNEKLSDAKMSGNALEVSRASYEYMQFMQNNNIKITSMLYPMLQFPFVVSAFLAIKKMCNLPVESFTTGGMLWFPNLSIADPYFILPTIAAGSILAIVYKGVETGMSAQSMNYTTKLIVYSLTAVSFPFFIFMPNGVMLYVCTTNMFSLATAFIMSKGAVKKFFKIPVLTPYEEQQIKESQKKQKNLLSGFRESMQNQKIINEVKERENLREKQFAQAGTKVPIKTFKTNPTLSANKENSKQ